MKEGDRVIIIGIGKKDSFWKRKSSIIGKHGVLIKIHQVEGSWMTAEIRTDEPIGVTETTPFHKVQLRHEASLTERVRKQGTQRCEIDAACLPKKKASRYAATGSTDGYKP